MRPVLLLIGYALAGLAMSMLLPALMALWIQLPNPWLFLNAALITSFFAVALILTQRQSLQDLSPKQAFIATAATWIIMIAFAALPFWLSGLAYSDALFEASSGLTTTGATIYRKLEVVRADILLWRALLQWFGGIGIIVVAILILPNLNVGGMQMFYIESSDVSGKLLPRTRSFGWAMLRLYLLASVTCWTAYMLADMSAFEAMLHAMTTISTGGFSTRTGSLAAFDNVAVELVAISFMIIGALPFVAYLRFLRVGPKALWQDSQIPAFLLLLGMVIAALVFYLLAQNNAPNLVQALRMVGFNVTAILTGTGYVTAPFDSWGHFATISFFVIALFGGCAGSTTGGIKIFRLQFLMRFLAQRLHLMLAPNTVTAMTYNRRLLTEPILLSAVIFIGCYVGVILCLALFLTTQGLDMLSAWSGSVAILGNVGPALGPNIGPMGHYAALTPLVKFVLATAMVLGRLELFTILVLLAPRFWTR